MYNRYLTAAAADAPPLHNEPPRNVSRADGEHAASAFSGLSRGLSELYQLEVDGAVIGTGSVASTDDECGVIGAVAVVPEHRHKGWGSYITRFLVQRIQATGKTPRLVSGYDEVAELYRQIGFAPCGRWGELYL